MALDIPLNCRIDVPLHQLRDFLQERTALSIQSPTLLAREIPYLGVYVLPTPGGEPLTIVQQDGVGSSIVCPQTLSDLPEALAALGLDAAEMGYMFAPPGMVTGKVYRQAIQRVKNFDPGLSGKKYQQLRQHVHHAEREGLEFHANYPYDAEEVDALIQEWVGNKFETDIPDKTSGWYGRAYSLLKVGERIGNIANDPFGMLYAATKDDRLVALNAVMEFGSHVGIEVSVSTRGTDRAQDFLDMHMWRVFTGRGVEIVEAGTYDRQIGSLLAYKEKFAPVELREFVCQNPRYSRFGNGH